MIISTSFTDFDSNSVKDFEILKNHKSNTTDTRFSWSADELTYLVQDVTDGTDLPCTIKLLVI